MHLSCCCLVAVKDDDVKSLTYAKVAQGMLNCTIQFKPKDQARGLRDRTQNITEEAIRTSRNKKAIELLEEIEQTDQCINAKNKSRSAKLRHQNKRKAKVEAAAEAAAAAAAEAPTKQKKRKRNKKQS